MYLTDTNVISEARRGSIEARTWLRSVHPTSVFLSVITLGEIAKGSALKARSDPRAAGSLRVWLETLRQDHGDRILPITDRIALEWGRLAALRPRAMADGLIAATAIIHSKVLVTRNVTDFADTGVQIIDPWNV
jgi:predicted nucleic acid-binding protein